MKVEVHTTAGTYSRHKDEDFAPTVEGLLQFKSETRITFARCVGKNRVKFLDLDTNGNYLVMFNETKIYFGPSAQLAIKEYNLLP